MSVLSKFFPAGGDARELLKLALFVLLVIAVARRLPAPVRKFVG